MTHTTKSRRKPPPKPIAMVGVVIEEDQNGSKLKINNKGVADFNLPRRRIRYIARRLGFDDIYYDARDLAHLVRDALGPVPSNMTYDSHENKLRITYEMDLNKVGEPPHDRSD